MSDTCAETTLETRTIYLSGELDTESIHEVFKAVDIFEAQSSDPVRVVLSSIGGDENDGWAIYDALRTLSGHIRVEGYGSVWSAATIVLQAGDWRALAPNATLLIHDSVVPKEDPPTNYGALIRTTKAYRDAERRYLDMIVARSCGQLRADQVRRWSRNEKFMTAEMALSYGLADEIIQPRRGRK